MKMGRLTFIFLLLFATGCGYKSRPIDIKELNERIETNNLLRFSSSVEAEAANKEFNFLDGLSEKEAIFIALAQNPDIVSERKNLGISEAQIIVAGQLENPVLGLEYGHSRIDHGNSYEWELSQLITGLITRSYKKSRAEIAFDQASLQLLLQEWILLNKTKYQYLNVLYKNELLKSSKEALRIADQLSVIAKKRLDAGAILQVEFNSIDVDKQKANHNVLIAEMALEIEKQRLSTLLGFPPQFEVKLNPAVEFNEIMATDFDVKKFEKYALENRLEIKVLELAYKKAEKDLEIHYVNRWPQIEIGPRFEDGEGRDDSRGITVGIQIPIWNRNEGNIKKGKIDREKVEEKLNASILQSKREVHAAVLKSNLTRKMLDAYKNKILSLVDTNLKLSDKSYQLGKIDLFQEIKAQSQYIESKREFTNLLYEYKLNSIELERAVGGSIDEVQNKAE